MKNQQSVSENSIKMSNKRKRVTFARIWKLIQETDTALGVFLFRDSKETTSIEKWFFTLTLPTLAILTLTLVISTVFATNFKLIYVILVFSMLSSIVTLFIVVFRIFLGKEQLKSFVKWCEDLYDIPIKYHPAVETIAESHLISTESHTVKIIQLTRTLFYVDNFGITMGIAFIGLFLPENVYPKYSPPVPFYLPFPNQETWLAFITTTLTETIIAVHVATLAIFIISAVFCIILHVLGYLDMIQAIAQKAKLEIAETIESNGNNDEKENNEVSFEEWMEIITEMISDVNSIISQLRDFYKESFLLNEMASLGSLFICGLVITVVKQQYLFAFGFIIVTLLLFSFCYVNEEILNRFEEIKETLYDFPWYELDCKKRKLLVIALNCDNIQRGLTAAGIHDITMERFGIVLKMGYSNMLILKDLIQK